MSEQPENLMPGAQASFFEGGPVGVLVLHGFTGNPASMRELAERLAASGCTVDLPRLPGHGTVVEDMMDVGWSDWAAHAEERYRDLVERCSQVVVVGMSMGGALTAWLGSRHQDMAGLVCINPVVTVPDGMRAAVSEVLGTGADRLAGIGSDIAMPGVTEAAYADTPLAPLLTMFDAAEAFAGTLGDITAPMLIITSRQDHVVPPENSDVLAASVAGPVERIWCERSYHVVTMDYDRELVMDATVDFVTKVTAGT